MSEQESRRLFWYRVKFLALIAVFISPFVGGWLALYVFEWRPDAGNYGELVQPVRKVDWPVLTAIDGKRYEGGFGGKWSFLLFVNGECKERCYSNLYYMRQLRTLLGRDTLRLQNLFVSARPLSEKTRVFLAEYPNLIVIENYREAELNNQFQLQGLERVGESERLYLVDPDQNFMMHYPADNDQNRVLEDIKKLMKLSRIG